MLHRFMGMGTGDLVWVPTVFTKNRDRLLTTDMSRKVMRAIPAHREVALLSSEEHFLVDGPLVKGLSDHEEPLPLRYNDYCSGL